MDKKREIQPYINNFRRLLSQHLKSDVGVQSKIFPYDKGCVIIFELGFHTSNKDEYKSSSNNILEALRKTNIFEDLNKFENHSFAGTNIILTKSSIILIKENNPIEWTESQVEEDLAKVIPSSQKETANG